MSVVSGRRTGAWAATPERNAERVAAPEPGVAETRRERLAALGRELEDRGLRGRLFGGDASVLGVVHPATGRAVMILATPAAPGGRLRWSYLWGGGGMADAANPAWAADEIVRHLS